ncbi:MAG: SPOR domain-containing protein, partial [Proteobacteria bacterium]|nr:SPOR domain-containing protein [Pseudomonadota bacterium]
YKTGNARLTQLKEQYPLSPYASDQNVQAQEKTPPEQASDQGADAAPVPGYTVQVGAFSTLKNAEELKTRFERESYAATISTVISNGKTLHKVWVGEFRTYDSAKRFTEEIKSKYNIESIVVTR